MSTPTGFLRGARALVAAARYTVTRSKTAVPAPSKEVNAVKKQKVVNEKNVSNTGIKKVTPVSHTLQSFLGSPEISFVGAVKKVWEYIKLHNLQNPSDKREILCDVKLKKVLGKDKVGMLEVAKLLSPHFPKN